MQQSKVSLHVLVSWTEILRTVRDGWSAIDVNPFVNFPKIYWKSFNFGNILMNYKQALEVKL